MDKKELRKEMLRKRNRLEEDYLSDSNKKITECFLASPAYLNASSIFIYISYSSEVDTKLIISKALEDGKTVLVPYTMQEKKEMIAIQITDFNTQLCTTCSGILEPNFVSKEPYSPDSIDLIVVPGVVFDRKGYRIGYGGGYYDKYLKEAKKAAKIGFVFSKCLIDEVPTEVHDIKVDRILTEREELVIK